MGLNHGEAVQRRSEEVVEQHRGADRRQHRRAEPPDQGDPTTASMNTKAALVGPINSPAATPIIVATRGSTTAATQPSIRRRGDRTPRRRPTRACAP